MVDYTNISNVSVEPLAPVTSELMTSLRDNPIAIAEGSVGAPNMYVGLANRLQAGALGTWAFAYCTTGDKNFGDVVPGSSLRPTGAAYGVTLAGASSETSFSLNLDSGAALSGSWTCLGRFDSGNTDNQSGGGFTRSLILRGATLWMRVV